MIICMNDYGEIESFGFTVGSVYLALADGRGNPSEDQEPKYLFNLSGGILQCDECGKLYFNAQGEIDRYDGKIRRIGNIALERIYSGGVTNGKIKSIGGIVLEYIYASGVTDGKIKSVGGTTLEYIYTSGVTNGKLKSIGGTVLEYIYTRDRKSVV